ncbi:MAG: FAD-dependent oxidoreductase [Candidatus Limnocylindrales bacterium]
MEVVTRRFIGLFVGLALVLWMPATPSIAANDLPITGTTTVAAVDSTVSIDLAYESTAPITAFRVSLAGPSFDGILFESTDAPNELTWSGSQGDLAAGNYTVTVWAEIERDGSRTSGSTTRTVRVGAATALPQPVGGTTAVPGPPPAYQEPAGLEPAGDISADIVVYGATPSGVMAAVSASRPGVDVVLIEPTGHAGGMMSNGLTATDYGHTAMLGGRTKEFFDRTQAAEGSLYGRYRFQPSTAERVFDQMLADAGVRVFTLEQLAEGNAAVTKNGTRIVDIQMQSGRRFSARVFVDASYEGDLMARAGASYRLGRESTAEYGEAFAGVRSAVTVFSVPPGIDPGVPLAAPGGLGSGDDRIQNSNYRLCFSTNPENQVPFTKPANYDPATYDLPAAYIASRVAVGYAPTLTWFLWPVALPNNKFDVNNNGPVSIGIMGLNTGYPDGSLETRSALAAQLREYTAGFLHFLAQDDRVPVEIRNQMAAYGLCRDEFADNENWPRMLYLREGRRMIGTYVLTERDVQVSRTKSDTIAVASYAFDSHHISRWIDGSGRLRVEGGFWNGRANATRWSIPYRSLTPQADKVTNLLVSVTASATHVAFAALRLEPQYMLMGEAAGTAAFLAAWSQTSTGDPLPVQKVDVTRLRELLRQQGSVVDNHLFWDIASSPFRGDIEATFLRDVTFGCSAIYYCPSSPTTREVMAGFLANALALPPTTRDYFTDDEGSPHEDSINRVAEAGVTAGCGAGKFCPLGTVARGQMAAFMVRAFELRYTPRDYFTDDETNMFEGDINRLAFSGITAGCGGTRFCPDNIVSREQMAAFLWRAIR